MDFKFKEVVEESIIYFYDQVLSSNEYTEDVFEELEHVYAQAAKADEYEAKNKELLEELQYLRKVNDDLVWQRDTDEEHEAKAKAWDKLSMSIRKCNKEIELKGGLNAMFRTSKKGQIVQRYIDCFESGGYDAKK